MSETRIVIADRVLVAEGLRHILKDAFLVVGTGGTSAQVRALCMSQRPDILLIDPGVFAPVELADLLRSSVELPSMKFIFTSDREDRLVLGRAIQAGARGFVLKQQRPEDLCDAIRLVAQGKTYVPPECADDLPWARTLKPLQGGDRASVLTPRQWQVLNLVAGGRTSKEIGLLLQISVKTVEFHRTSLMAGLGLYTVAELSRFAMQHGIVGPLH